MILCLCRKSELHLENRIVNIRSNGFNRIRIQLPPGPGWICVKIIDSKQRLLRNQCMLLIKEDFLLKIICQRNLNYLHRRLDRILSKFILIVSFGSCKERHSLVAIFDSLFEYFRATILHIDYEFKHRFCSKIYLIWFVYTEHHSIFQLFLVDFIVEICIIIKTPPFLYIGFVAFMYRKFSCFLFISKPLSQLKIKFKLC